jgi:nicotinamidase-related amidase
MQEGFRSPEAEIIITPILKLTIFFEEEGDEIALVKFINSPKSWFATRLDWTDFQDTADQRILKELEVAKGFVVYHDTYTVLNQDLQEYISKKEITEVFLCGVFTDVCITKTAMDLFDLQILCKAVEDACNSLHGKKHHRQTVDSLKHILGRKKVVKVEAVINSSTNQSKQC